MDTIIVHFGYSWFYREDERREGVYSTSPEPSPQGHRELPPPPGFRWPLTPAFPPPPPPACAIMCKPWSSLTTMIKFKPKHPLDLSFLHVHSRQIRFLLQVSHDDKKGFTSYETGDADMPHASSFMGLLIDRLNSMVKGSSSKIPAARLSIKKRCFGKAANLSVRLLYKSRRSWTSLLIINAHNGPLERIPRAKH